MSSVFSKVEGCGKPAAVVLILIFSFTSLVLARQAETDELRPKPAVDREGETRVERDLKEREYDGTGKLKPEAAADRAMGRDTGRDGGDGWKQGQRAEASQRDPAVEARRGLQSLAELLRRLRAQRPVNPSKAVNRLSKRTVDGPTFVKKMGGKNGEPISQFLADLERIMWSGKHKSGLDEILKMDMAALRIDYKLTDRAEDSITDTLLALWKKYEGGKGRQSMPWTLGQGKNKADLELSNLFANPVLFIQLIVAQQLGITEIDDAKVVVISYRFIKEGALPTDTQIVDFVKRQRDGGEERPSIEYVNYARDHGDPNAAGAEGKKKSSSSSFSSSTGRDDQSSELWDPASAQTWPDGGFMSSGEFVLSYDYDTAAAKLGVAREELEGFNRALNRLYQLLAGGEYFDTFTQRIGNVLSMYVTKQALVIEAQMIMDRPVYVPVLQRLISTKGFTIALYGKDEITEKAKILLGSEDVITGSAVTSLLSQLNEYKIMIVRTNEEPMDLREMRVRNRDVFDKTVKQMVVRSGKPEPEDSVDIPTLVIAKAVADLLGTKPAENILGIFFREIAKSDKVVIVEKSDYESVYADVVKKQIDGIFVFDDRIKINAARRVSEDVAKDIQDAETFMSNV